MNGDKYRINKIRERERKSKVERRRGKESQTVFYPTGVICPGNNNSKEKLKCPSPIYDLLSGYAPTHVNIRARNPNSNRQVLSRKR